MADNEKNIQLDNYSKPSFDPALLTQIAITEGYNYLDAPSNLDRIQVELIDEYDNTVQSIVKHISDIDGIIYESGRLQVDTFSILTQQFNKTSGRYTVKISGFRNYIYEEIEDESTEDENDSLNPSDVEPGDITFAPLEIIEFSRTRKEVRVKSNNNTAKAFTEFYEEQSPHTIPVQGKYWKYERTEGERQGLAGDPMFYSATGEINKSVSLQFTSDAAYDNHREARGLPFGPDNYKRWNGSFVVTPDHKFLRWMRDTPDGRRLESESDIWPITLRVISPDGTFVDMISTNWMEHSYTPKKVEGEDDPEAIDSVIFKLATPAPKGMGAGVNMQVMRPLFVPYTIPLEIDIPYVIDEMFTELRGPNLRLDVNKNSSKGTTSKNETDLTGTQSGIKARLEKSILSGSSTITTNTDYREFKHFVHFSSAIERLKNFKYKLTRIEHYASKSIALGSGFGGSDSSVTGSSNIIANKLEFDNLQKSLINSFNPYEQYLYYNSHSAEVIYDNIGKRTLSAATWPKSLDTKTGIGYNLFSVTSSQAVEWYAGRLTSASLWDEQNQSALRNVIPTHVRVDDQNTSYQLFFDMIGEHFDEIYLQIQGLEESYRRDESVDVGLSKDLLFDTAKSFGWDLYPGHSTTELWEYALGTDDQGTYQASGSGTTQTFVVKESHSSEDIEKQTWKRLLNNLPLLLKTKGTARGVRALLSSYGVPLTILNIDEYGGAPATRTEDKRAIEKFAYGINMSGSNRITTEHEHFKQAPNGTSTIDSLTTPGANNRGISMYEVRVDTSKQQTQYIARSALHEGVGPNWEVRMEHSSSAAGWDTAAGITAGSASVYAQYGRFTFEISSSAGQPAISASTEYMPIYDNDWWNVSFGVTEHPYKKEAPGLVPESQSFQIRCAKAAEHAQGRITHQSTGTVIGNSSSYSGVWSDHTDTIWGNKGLDPTPGVESFSGSLQEIRAWAEYLSDTAFHQHTLAPTSIVGDSVQMGYNDLLIRLPLGTDSKTYNHHSIATVTSSLPNTNNLKWSFNGRGEGGLFTGFTNNPYSPKSETYFVKVPHTAGPSKHSNKVRIEDNTLRGNQLARDKSFEVSSFDSNPLDSEDVSVVLSPADQIDTDISMQFGGFDLDDYIGDPRDRFKTEYTSLRDTKNLYFKKYSEGNSVMAFIKYLRSFNKGLFKQIEEMIPARADAIVGIEIRPNLLERHKLGQPISASQETFHITSSLSLVTSSTLPGDIPSQGIQDASNYGTFTGTLGIGAPPSQQRSGSSNHYNLYDGATYLRDIFGETTESGELVTVLDSRRNFAENRIQIPTYNLLNAPAHNITATGSGWITVFENNFTIFKESAKAGVVYGVNDIDSSPDTWKQTAGEAGTDGVVVPGGGVQFGDNAGNDQWWGHSAGMYPFEPNTLYKMTITVSSSVDTGNDNKVYAGFNQYIQDLNKTGTTDKTVVSGTTGGVGPSSAAYFAASGKQLALPDIGGLGVDITFQGYLGNTKTCGQNYNQVGLTQVRQSKYPAKGIHGQQEKIYTHFSPMLLVNYSGDDGITRITHMKVEALPGAYVDVQPQYDASLAQRRLVIDGTRMSSPDFNVGSSDTIDGGPVAEFQLVNPNIVQVAPAPGRPLAPNRPGGLTVQQNGNRPALGNTQQAQNNNLTVR